MVGRVKYLHGKLKTFKLYLNPKDALLVYDITNDKIIAQFKECNGGIEFTPVMIDATRACVMTLGRDSSWTWRNLRWKSQMKIMYIL